MQKTPKITLITVVRNGAAFIERCLQSVVDQHYDNLEYIVLDGASTDGTQDIIERYRSHITTYYSRPDKGAYDAAQQSFGMITGDIVGFLMADDWLSPGALNTIASLYAKKPDTDIFCFGMQEFRLGEGGQLYKSKEYCDPEGNIFTLLDGMYCQGVNRFYSATIMKEEGFFRESVYKNLADRDLYMRLGLRNIKKAWTGEMLYNFLVHTGSNSTGGDANKFVTFLDETGRIAKDYLKYSGLSSEDKINLVDWYCFNSIRSVWFRIKAKRYADAVFKACSLVVQHPMAVFDNMLHWQMPEGYRAKVSK